jgi:hypothetical protein
VGVCGCWFVYWGWFVYCVGGWFGDAFWIDAKMHRSQNTSRLLPNSTNFPFKPVPSLEQLLVGEFQIRNEALRNFPFAGSKREFTLIRKCEMNLKR